MDTCVFCRIVRGELPASVIHEDEHTLAFMNIMAGNPGHALVIVKPHVENIYTLDDALAAAVFRTTTRVAKAVRAAAGCEGVSLFQANEVAGGQTVFHFHIHVLPRLPGDALPGVWPAVAPSREALDAMAARLRAAL
ncbi:MAG TPA: HIT domain-containing protein [Rhodocyclaceae bacterium]|nr:HIT domain-containing protein [Rhodocyclaceae bacterium]HNB64141.1 HIT domain-containing protein [Rhodocyclaceae bacterium]